MAETNIPSKYILAIDHGTSGIKTALISIRGEVVGFEYEPTPIHFLPGGGAEQDPDDWWNAVIKTSQRLIQRRLVPVDDIVAVGVSSTFSSTVMVDENGRHLMNSLTWMDSRGAPYIKQVAGGFPEIMGYNIFKMLLSIYKTGGGPQLSGKDDIGHVLLVKHEFPKVYAATRAFLGSKDYLNLRFTGKIAASYDAMALFWLARTRDIDNIRYDDLLIRYMGVDKTKLPPMQRSIDILGEILPEVADEIGLPRGVKVVTGSPDHQSALVGSGAVRDFEGHIYIGTSSWIQCIVPFKKTDALHSIASLPTAIPGKYYAANEQDIAGGSLSFLVENILYHQNRLKVDDPPEDIYLELDRIAASVPPGSEKVIFTPWLNGERTPVDDIYLRGGLHNLSVTTNMDHLIRAMLEGVAYNNRWALHYVEKFIGREMPTLNIVGGGAKSGVWCQIFADVMQRRIRQVRDPMQANARGAAWIAAVGLGYITFDDIPGLIQYENTYEPNPDNRKIYDALYREFKIIYRNNAAMYRRLNAVGKSPSTGH